MQLRQKQAQKKGAERVIITVIEHLIGRKEHDTDMKANEYINKSFDDVWAAIIRLYVLLLLVAIIRKDRKP